MPERTPQERAVLAAAKARLDRLDLYPAAGRPGSRAGAPRVPWLFRLPWFARFDGYDVGPLILLRRPIGEASEDLVTHELCHAWQAQHRIVRMCG